MTRIIAGTAGGRRIAVPPKGTRPTTDRVREAMFSALSTAGALQGARVLDGFAGSGALGLEALSRGATHATFVESHPPAARIIAENAKAIGLASQAQVIKERVLGFLERSEAEFDLVFLDPPYDIDPDDLADALAALAPRLSADAVVVVEWSSRSPEPRWPEGIERFRTKKYGETTLWYAEAAAGESGDDPHQGSSVEP